MINLELLKLRAQHANNDRQHDRMVQDKLRSFHRALLYSYQTVWIKKDGDEDAEYIRALINPDKVKFDYDEKIVSIDFIHGFKSGDTFEWKGTDTHWIILKTELTEIAYFRGNIRRCQLLEVTDPDTKEQVPVWGAIRGPVETKIDSIQKTGIAMHRPNMTLNIYVPSNEQNLKLFNRYFKFKYAGLTWMVTAYDSISTPGIIEFTAQEDYNCDHEDLLIEPIDPNPPVEETAPQIIGDTFVKPLMKYAFEAIPLTVEYTWELSLENTKQNVKDVLSWEINDNIITVTWTAMVSGSYILRYGDLTKTVIVESLF